MKPRQITNAEEDIVEETKTVVQLKGDIRFIHKGKLQVWSLTKPAVLLKIG